MPGVEGSRLGVSVTAETAGGEQAFSCRARVVSARSLLRPPPRWRASYHRSVKVVRCGPASTGLPMQPLDDGAGDRAKGRALDVHMAIGDFDPLVQAVGKDLWRHLGSLRPELEAVGLECRHKVVDEGVAREVHHDPWHMRRARLPSTSRCAVVRPRLSAAVCRDSSCKTGASAQSTRRPARPRPLRACPADPATVWIATHQFGALARLWSRGRCQKRRSGLVETLLGRFTGRPGSGARAPCREAIGAIWPTGRQPRRCRSLGGSSGPPRRIMDASAMRAAWSVSRR